MSEKKEIKGYIVRVEFRFALAIVEFHFDTAKEAYVFADSHFEHARIRIYRQAEYHRAVKEEISLGSLLEDGQKNFRVRDYMEDELHEPQ